MRSHVIYRRRNRTLLTVIKTVALVLFGCALISTPLAIAAVGNLAGIP